MTRINIAIIIILIFSTVSCSKDEDAYPCDYPFIIMNVDPVLKDGSVTFSATILQDGKEEIVTYGFAWRDNKWPSIHTDHYLYPGKVDGDTFTHTISTAGMLSDKTYSVKAYIATSTYEVYSNPLTYRK